LSDELEVLMVGQSFLVAFTEGLTHSKYSVGPDMFIQFQFSDDEERRGKSQS
jgi:hypothetical protein